tara:strand:- start:66 stop:470 length:405 start_codon:yes stop_codon:yes gene_type:complete
MEFHEEKEKQYPDRVTVSVASVNYNHVFTQTTFKENVLIDDPHNKNGVGKYELLVDKTLKYPIKMYDLEIIIWYNENISTGGLYFCVETGVRFVVVTKGKTLFLRATQPHNLQTCSDHNRKKIQLVMYSHAYSE